MSEYPSGFGGGDDVLNEFADNNPINEVEPLGLSADPPMMDPNFVGPPKPQSLEEYLLENSTKIVEEVGKMTPKEREVGVDIPGRSKGGNGPCYWFAKKFIDFLRRNIKIDPRFRIVRVETIIRPKMQGTDAVNHIIVRVFIPREDGKGMKILYFDAGPADNEPWNVPGVPRRFGNMAAGPNGLIDRGTPDMPGPLPQDIDQQVGQPVPKLPTAKPNNP